MRTTLPRIAACALAAGAVIAVTATVFAGGASGQVSQVAQSKVAVTEVSSGAQLRPAAAGSTFGSVFLSPQPIEGLTGDNHGFLYAAARGAAGMPCPVYRVPVGGGAMVVVGNLPAPCGPAGLAFDAHGRLFVGDGARIEVLTPSAASPPTATVFTAAVAGANGLAFDRRGQLWVSDGGTGQGRVWRIGADGVPQVMFRVQPMENDVNVVNGVGGVGRDPRSLPPGTVTITPDGRASADTAGSQHIVANGLAFSADGRTLFVADTARGAIWRVSLDARGALRSQTGCDTTFSPDTLCLDNVFVAHPALEGSDGIAVDRAGNIWSAANERNAIVVVTPRARVVEFFRNAPDPATRLRNNGPLEFPTSPFLAGRTLCVTQSDGSRRDNAPSTGGEATPTGTARAKIACLDQQLPLAGLTLPI
jgi:sugar lactone lactonase YvrE